MIIGHILHSICTMWMFLTYVHKQQASWKCLEQWTCIITTTTTCGHTMVLYFANAKSPRFVSVTLHHRHTVLGLVYIDTQLDVTNGAAGFIAVIRWTAAFDYQNLLRQLARRAISDRYRWGSGIRGYVDCRIYRQSWHQTQATLHGHKRPYENLPVWPACEA